MGRLLRIAFAEVVNEIEEKELNSYEEQFKKDVTALKIDNIMALICKREYVCFYLSYDLDCNNDDNNNSSIYRDIEIKLEELCSEHIKYKQFTDSTNGIVLCDSDKSVKPDKVFTGIQKIFKDIKEKNKSILKNFILIQLLDNDKWFIENTQ